ncbi:MAG TPA: hypothetical protein VGF56_06965 [Rhizomicrobium sp.]|jgi:hypothetical protein
MRQGLSIALGAASLVGALSFAAPASADVGYFLGHWDNVDHTTSNIPRVHISPAGGWDVKVHAWGQCHPTDCDWGTSVGHYEAGWGGEKIKVQFNSGFSLTKLELRHGGGDQLQYKAHTEFTDGSGRAPYNVAGDFYRTGGGGGGGYGPPGGGGYGPPGPPGGGGGYGPPGPPPGGGGGYGPPPGPSVAEDCIGLNPMAAQAAYVGGEWKVVDGGSWLLSYGTDSASAHHAADVIHHYHFDQQCFVKRPHAAMMYWKTGDHVPSGNTSGQDCIGLDPNHTHADHVGGAWKVVDGGNWLLDYGSDAAAAHQAADIIHTYNLNRQCFITRPNAPMMYWLSQ